MRRLYRSKEDRKISGICGGLGELLGIDPNIFRLGSILLALTTGVFPVLVTYLVAWMILPEGGPQEDGGHPEVTKVGER